MKLTFNLTITPMQSTYQLFHCLQLYLNYNISSMLYNCAAGCSADCGKQDIILDYLLHLSATPCTAGVLSVLRNSTKSLEAFALSALAFAMSTVRKKVTSFSSYVVLISL